MKKVIGKVAFHLLIDFPLAAAGAWVAVRAKQLAETHTDEEIKEIIKGLYGAIGLKLMSAAARVQDAEDKSHATAGRTYGDTPRRGFNGF